MLHENATCGATNDDQQMTAEPRLMPARAKRSCGAQNPAAVSWICVRREA